MESFKFVILRFLLISTKLGTVNDRRMIIADCLHFTTFLPLMR